MWCEAFPESTLNPDTTACDQVSLLRLSTTESDPLSEIDRCRAPVSSEPIGPASAALTHAGPAINKTTANQAAFSTEKPATQWPHLKRQSAVNWRL